MWKLLSQHGIGGVPNHHILGFFGWLLVCCESLEALSQLFLNKGSLPV